MSSAERVRWWHRLKRCPEGAPKSGYQCPYRLGHKGQHSVNICIDAQDALYYDESWGELIDGSDDAT